MDKQRWDVIIVGAGPAGMSAALILGRCLRRVLICDAGTPRNWAAREMHSYLSRDGIEPKRFRAISRSDLTAYPNIAFRAVEATRIKRKRNGTFEVELGKRSAHTCRKLLLATGMLDQLPAVSGIEQFFGTSVHQCPYCEGWEMRGRSIAVYGKGQRGFEMARAMTAWSPKLTLCSDGAARLDAAKRTLLKANGVDVITTKIERLLGTGAQLRKVRFKGGREISCDALFFDTPCQPRSPLAKQLRLRMTATGGIHCGEYEASSVPGVYAAGNILKDVQLSIVAAAEGARAAFGINRTLTREDFIRHARTRTRTGDPRKRHSA